ncbi:HAD superfamily hydrolase (TIGR01549 family) [Tumebacillus sp. BK434]|uniref:HAD family hydrolase n=1 Tax=Tumebacillus sp. BK434 TaxID=2512169 RepID=UPI00104544DB|nr:HAD-IA family hydrolase [Tumebacillus sp. BK434]TCP52324.1 HAD superfamily hydrolase (TIGR01549 family) [Tumebacillus sp. BK434]
MRAQVMIFDVDGTLYQTEKVAVPAFRSAFDQLIEKGIYQGDIPSQEHIISCFGMTIPELWETLLPNASMDVRDQANELVAQAEIRLMEQGKGELYPGVKETLQQLHSQGVKLYTASNGEKRYVETVAETTGIAPLFTKLFTAGEYKTEKKEQLVRLVLEHAGTDQAVMVGDRRSDITAGKVNHLFTVGCDFGFAGQNELVEADRIINNFPDLLSKVKEGQDNQR